MTNGDEKKWVDLGGDELTRWGHWESDDELELTAERLAQALTADFWRNIELQALDCERILTEHGFPAAGQYIRYDRDGNWWDDGDPNAPDWKDIPGGGAMLGANFIATRAKPFSDAWYAGRLAGYIDIVSKNKNAADEWQLQRILNIGLTAMDWKWRSNYKPSIVTGTKQRKVLSQHREQAIKNSKAGAEKRRALLLPMLDDKGLTGGALEIYLQKRLQKDCKIFVDRRTIRRDLAKLRSA